MNFSTGQSLLTVQIYDGYNEEAPILLDSPCGYSTPAPFTSTSNYIYVTATFSSRFASKFKLKWMSEAPQPEVVDKCNATTITLTDRGKRLSSPGYPNGYDANLNCTWIIKTEDPVYHAVFNPLVVDLEEVQYCLADYVSVYTSSDLISWTKNDTLCNESNRREYHGTPYLMIQFRADHFLNKTGFDAMLYPRCGGRLTNSSGVITLSVTNNRMISSSSCGWEIQVRNGRKIQFSFDDLNIPSSGSGCRDAVTIKNGGDDFSPPLGIYCGTEKPQNINVTFSNRAFVRVSIQPIADFHFTLRYEEVAQECGDEITLTDTMNSTVIHSPNYPFVPDPHTECVWKIWSKAGEALQVEFIERFDLSMSPSCETEYVEVRSGATQLSPVLGRFCRKPEIQHAPSNVVLIKYFTDIPYPKNGFKARISMVGCDRVFRGQSGVVETPPILHGDLSTICEYTIVVPAAFKVSLNFTKTCNNDEEFCPEGDLFEVITVFPMPFNNETASSVANYSHENFPDDLFLESNKVVIRFRASVVAEHRFHLKLNYKAVVNNCGGTLTGSSGEITSPGYPNAQYRQKTCVWTVTVPKGRRIKVEILDLDLTRTGFSGLSMQMLSFYQDAKSFIRITTLSGSTIPPPIYSSDNVMKIRYFVLNSANIKGFKLRYSSDEPTICEGSLDEQSGILQKPANASTIFCKYERTDKPFFEDTHRGTISFRIQDTNLATVYASFLRCHHFQSRVRVTTAPIPELSKVCGSIADETLASPFTTTGLEITSLKEDDRYKIYYEIDRCGEIFSGPFQISENDFPNKTGALNCAWFYKSTDVLDLSIEYNGSFSSPCTDEYLIIYNGPNADSPQLAKLCEQNPLTKIHSRSANLLLQYHANIFNSSSRFSVNVRSLSSECGGVLHKSVPRVQSPGNGSYANNMDCTWEFVADNGYMVNLSFVERFYLEDSTNCSKDFVEIFDLVNEDWVSLGRFCGRQPPANRLSSESRMKVRFVTDAQVSADGFVIQWSQKCGGVYTVSEKKRTLASPGYPNRYPSDLKCNYTLVGPTDQFISVRFTAFDVENRKNCDFDNVTIYARYDYDPHGEPSLRETFCSNRIPAVQRFKGQMSIIFTTDRFIQKKGFEFEYKLDACGGVINNSTTITSNSDTPLYATSHSCRWNITAPDRHPDAQVVLRFNYFELGHSQGCYMDFVDIYDGPGTDAKRLIRLCGNLTDIPVLKLSQSEGSIVFNSGYEAFRGFSVEVIFTNRCDRRINLTTSAPTYELREMEQTYVPGMDCHYVVLAPPDYTLNLEFMNFHMLECQFNNTAIDRCSCDFLEVRDGRGPFSELIGRYCGHELPQSIRSTRGGLYLRLVTDSGPVSTGLIAKFSIVPNSCGEYFYNITDSAKTLSYPLNSGNYTNNANCMWVFNVPGSEYYNMVLHFDRMDIQKGSNGVCNTDYLEVYDNLHSGMVYEGLGADVVFAGTEQTHVQVGFWDARNVRTKHVYCGGLLPPTFVSKTNQVFVRFRSDSEVTGRGFSITATSTSGQWIGVVVY